MQSNNTSTNTDERQIQVQAHTHTHTHTRHIYIHVHMHNKQTTRKTKKQHFSCLFQVHGQESVHDKQNTEQLNSTFAVKHKIHRTLEYLVMYLPIYL